MGSVLARAWSGTATSHECKGKAKGARLHSFGACREAFYVAEEKARLREGAAKLRADEDRDDSSSEDGDASAR